MSLGLVVRLADLCHQSRNVVQCLVSSRWPAVMLASAYPWVVKRSHSKSWPCIVHRHSSHALNFCRDCGLACALMVLKSLGVSCLTMASLRSLCSTTRYFAPVKKKQILASHLALAMQNHCHVTATLASCLCQAMQWLLTNLTCNMLHDLAASPRLLLSIRDSSLAMLHLVPKGYCISHQMQNSICGMYMLEVCSNSVSQSALSSSLCMLGACCCLCHVTYKDTIKRVMLYSPAFVVVYSVWTVDLAHLMRHFGLDVTLATTMVGANPGYFHEGFYMENMAEDQCRVTQLFQVSKIWHAIYGLSLTT